METINHFWFWGTRKQLKKVLSDLLLFYFTICFSYALKELFNLPVLWTFLPSFEVVKLLKALAIFGFYKLKQIEDNPKDIRKVFRSTLHFMGIYFIAIYISYKLNIIYGWGLLWTFIPTFLIVLLLIIFLYLVLSRGKSIHSNNPMKKEPTL